MGIKDIWRRFKNFSWYPPLYWWRRRRPTTRLGFCLVALALVAVLIYAVTDSLDAWMPNAATDLASIALTVVIVERIIRQENIGEARARIHQALMSIFGDFLSAADFVLDDYIVLHRDRYERPPGDLPGLLEHFRDGVPTRDTDWPEKLGIFAALASLARHTEHQLERHDRVLDHGFVAAAWTYIRAARLARSSWQATVGDVDQRKGVAVTRAASALLVFYGAFLPYARDFVDDPVIFLTKEEIDEAEQRRADL